MTEPETTLQLIFSAPAQLVMHTRTPVDQLMALARERAQDVSIFDEYEPYFWMAEISNRNPLWMHTSDGEPGLLRHFGSAGREAGGARSPRSRAGSRGPGGNPCA